MGDLLCDALEHHRKLDMISLHTPGHKNNFDGLRDLWEYDYTELPDTDSLFEASGAILQSENFAATVFGTKKTMYSAGGCTLAIQAMIRLVAPCGGKVIFGRTIHKSAINASALLGIDPVFILPGFDAGEYMPGRILPVDVENALTANSDAKAVYITSPDYFGVISDIGAIAKICEKFNVPLIVDNAHGTHLKFLSSDMHPISLGATLSADSAHKTLPVFTGGALLQIGEDRFVSDAREAMALFASTSPSYPIMASIDKAMVWADKYAKSSFSCLEEKVQEILRTARNYGFCTPIGVCDPTRVSLNTRSIGITGIRAADFLRKNGFEPEYANQSYVVMIPTPFVNCECLDKLMDVIRSIPDNCRDLSDQCDLPINEIFTFDLPTKEILPREALLSQKKVLPIDDTINKICAEVATVCPPGIPVVMPGEKISKDVVDLLKRYGFFKLKVVK